jgi:hypothetical protein
MSPRSGSRSRSPSASRRSSGRPTQTQGAASNYKDLLSEQVNRTCREALGRSRGGLTTKIHLAADQRCRPVAFITSEGQRHDSIAFQTVLELVSIDRLGPGRPRSRPDWVLADKAYSSKAHRDYSPVVGSRPLSRSRTTRPPRGARRARGVADRRVSTERGTASATPLNGRSTSSATIGPQRPATRNATSSIAAPSPSPASGFGSTTRPKPDYQTRPR